MKVSTLTLIDVDRLTLFSLLDLIQTMTCLTIVFDNINYVTKIEYVMF